MKQEQRKSEDKMYKIIETILTSLVCFCSVSQLIGKCEAKNTKTIEELFYEHEDEKNSMIAISSKDDSEEAYEDFYDELDNWMAITASMNILFFGPSASFMRLSAETLLHLLIHTKKHLVPISKALLAWDIVTDGKTAAFLRGREFLAFGSLLNVVPEEDLYYINFGDDSVLKYFAKYRLNLSPRKVGVLVASYKRYFGPDWHKNGTYINALGYLLCGFPPSDFMQIKPEVFRDITVETLNKIYRCSAKQPKLLQLMYEHAIRRYAYGHPYKWSSHEINRLGMLLTLVPEADIPSIQLEAITAITPDVMKAMRQSKLEYFTKQQIFRMNPKTRRMFILRRQLMQMKNIQTMNQLSKRSSSSTL